MKKWCVMLTRLGGGSLLEFGDDLFRWLDGQIVVVDDYVYVRVEFRGDLDMVLPDGEDFDDDLGEFFFNIFHFLWLFFKIFDLFGFLTYSMCHCRRYRKGSPT